MRNVHRQRREQIPHQCARRNVKNQHTQPAKNVRKVHENDGRENFVKIADDCRDFQMKFRQNLDGATAIIDTTCEQFKALSYAAHSNDAVTKLNDLTQRVPEEENYVEIVKFQRVDFDAGGRYEVIDVD